MVAIGKLSFGAVLLSGLLAAASGSSPQEHDHTLSERAARGGGGRGGGGGFGRPAPAPAPKPAPAPAPAPAPPKNDPPKNSPSKANDPKSTSKMEPSKSTSATSITSSASTSSSLTSSSTTSASSSSASSASSGSSSTGSITSTPSKTVSSSTSGTSSSTTATSSTKCDPRKPANSDSPICSAKDCRGSDATRKCIVAANKGCPCLVVAKDGPGQVADQKFWDNEQKVYSSAAGNHDLVARAAPACYFKSGGISADGKPVTSPFAWCVCDSFGTKLLYPTLASDNPCGYTTMPSATIMPTIIA